MRRQPREFEAPTFVTPTGKIEFSSEPSTWTGGRGGSLHRSDGSLRPQLWVSECWHYCNAQPTRVERSAHSIEQGCSDVALPLSFLDEVTALAAGHRPCHNQQPKEAKRFLDCWTEPDQVSNEPWVAIDRKLHQDRLDEFGQKRTVHLHLKDLPDHSMFTVPAGSYLRLGGRSFLWSSRGYVVETSFDDNDLVEVLTPMTVLGVLSAGYQPDIHESLLRSL